MKNFTFGVMLLCIFTVSLISLVIIEKNDSRFDGNNVEVMLTPLMDSEISMMHTHMKYVETNYRTNQDVSYSLKAAHDCADKAHTTLEAQGYDLEHLRAIEEFVHIAENQ